MSSTKKLLFRQCVDALNLKSQKYGIIKFQSLRTCQNGSFWGSEITQIDFTLNLTHWKNISSNQLFSNFFRKCVDLTEFLRKTVAVKFRNFHTVVRRSKFKANLEFIYQISVKSTYFYTQLHFHEILTNSEFSKLCFYSVHSVCRKTKTSVSIKKNFVKSVYYETL